MNEIKQLKNMVKEKGMIIDELERRVEDLEQHIGKDDVIISGLDVKPRTHASRR